MVCTILLGAAAGGTHTHILWRPKMSKAPGSCRFIALFRWYISWGYPADILTAGFSHTACTSDCDECLYDPRDSRSLCSKCNTRYIYDSVTRQCKGKWI